MCRGRRLKYLERLSATVARLGRCRSLPREVVALAQAVRHGGLGPSEGTRRRCVPRAVNAASAEVPATYLLWLICAVDRLDHAVTDTDFEAGRAAGHGTYQAICGHTGYVCSLLTPPGPPCPPCQQRLAEPPRRLANSAAAAARTTKG